MPALWESLKKISCELSDVSDNPRFEAELILSEALKMSRAELLGKVKENVKIPQIVEEWVQRRKKHEPIAYIVGYTEFFGIKIKTKRPIFIPRPETELIVEKCLQLIENYRKNKIRILELCTGTGCISIAICRNSRKKIDIFATDVNNEAVKLAQENARNNNANIRFIIADLFEPFNNMEKYDLILANPPYISEKDREKLPNTVKNYEDPGALFCHNNGLDIIRRIVQQSINYLVPGGWLLLEIGENQKEQTEEIFRNGGYCEIETFNDLQSLPRVVIGKLKPDE